MLLLGTIGHETLFQVVAPTVAIKAPETQAQVEPETQVEAQPLALTAHLCIAIYSAQKIKENLMPSNVKWVVIKHGIEHPQGPGKHINCRECQKDIEVPSQALQWEDGKTAVLFVCAECGCQFVGILQE